MVSIHRKFPMLMRSLPVAEIPALQGQALIAEAHMSIHAARPGCAKSGAEFAAHLRDQKPVPNMSRPARYRLERSARYR